MKNWQEEVPTEDGLYWLRRQGESDIIVKIWDSARGLEDFGAMVAWIGTDWDSSLVDIIDKQKCLWQKAKPGKD